MKYIKTCLSFPPNSLCSCQINILWEINKEVRYPGRRFQHYLRLYHQLDRPVIQPISAALQITRLVIRRCPANQSRALKLVGLRWLVVGFVFDVINTPPTQQCLSFPIAQALDDALPTVLDIVLCLHCLAWSLVIWDIVYTERVVLITTEMVPKKKNMIRCIVLTVQERIQSQTLLLLKV